jgi:hypothetical protein
MTGRFPLLEQLRADRQRIEEEIAAPFVTHIGRMTVTIKQLREENQEYSRLLSKGIEDRLVKAIRAYAADRFAPMLMQALCVKPNGSVTVTVTMNDLRFLHPDQAEQMLLAKARAQIGEQVFATVLGPRSDRQTATEQRSTIVRFVIPQLVVEVPVASA